MAGVWWRAHLVLHGFAAALAVSVGDDDTVVIHPGLPLSALLQNPHSQPTAQDDGRVTWTQNAHKFSLKHNWYKTTTPKKFEYQ